VSLYKYIQRCTQQRRVYSWETPGVDRHHRIIRNTHSFFPSSWSDAPLPSFDRSMQCVRFLTHCCQVFIDRTHYAWFIMAGYPFICSHPSPILLERVWRCTWRPWYWELGGHNRADLEIHLEAKLERVWRCAWTQSLSEFGDMHFEAMRGRTCRP